LSGQDGEVAGLLAPRDLSAHDVESFDVIDHPSTLTLAPIVRASAVIRLR
jgi:hypothetical protein